MKRLLLSGLVALIATFLVLVQAVPAALHTQRLTQSSTLFLPLIEGGRGTPGPPPIQDVRIDELLWDTADEQVIVTNYGRGVQVMTGWSIHSVVGDQWFYFPAGYRLSRGATVYVHSGPDAYSTPPAHLLWATQYIWNNLGDEAILYDGNGNAVDSICYGEGCP